MAAEFTIYENDGKYYRVEEVFKHPDYVLTELRRKESLCSFMEVREVKCHETAQAMIESSPDIEAGFADTTSVLGSLADLLSELL